MKTDLPPGNPFAPGAGPAPPIVKVRVWVPPTILLALICPVIEPAVGFGLFSLISLFIVLYILPRTRQASRRVLGLTDERRFVSIIKMISFGLFAALLLIISIHSRNAHEARKLAEAERIKAQVERNRLVEKGNAEVDRLMTNVRRQLEASNVPGATVTLGELLAIQHATNKEIAKQLQESIALSADIEAIRSRLLLLTDTEFHLFASENRLPPRLNLGYPVLNNALATLAQSMMADVKLEREALAKQEADRKRQEEFTRAESERRRRERLAAAEAAAERPVQEKLDAYIALITLDDLATELVDSVAVERRGDDWTAKITVKNLWHLRNKQLRLQDAQNLWRAWAILTSKHDLDKARITLLDLNGNQVGGSRILAGSLIWVQD